MITVPFKPASSRFPSRAKAWLEKVAQKMREQPALTVTLVGHADESGSEDRNMALSLDRANRVAKFLTSRRVAASRITVKGHGSNKPLDPGKTPQALAKNRRVEVYLK